LFCGTARASSSRICRPPHRRDIAVKREQGDPRPFGEVNVRQNEGGKAPIGGEGNGGVIFQNALGRDAPVGQR